MYAVTMTENYSQLEGALVTQAFVEAQGKKRGCKQVDNRRMQPVSCHVLSHLAHFCLLHQQQHPQA